MNKLTFLVFSIIFSNTPCIPNCQECNYDQTCKTCQSGYGLFVAGNSKTAACQLCISNCESCDRLDSCLICNKGYGLDKLNRCDKCAEYCISCQFNGSGQCDTCIQGYGRTANKTCQPCAPNCFSCTLNGAGLCDICNKGYGLTSNNMCDFCNGNSDGDLTVCNSCWTSGAAKCDVCNPNEYYLSLPKYTCESCPPTVSTDLNYSKYCDYCNEYSISNNLCVKCSDNCLHCSTSGAGKCDVCQDGYYLDNDACVACIQNCASCSAAATCDSCVEPYRLNQNYTCEIYCSTVNNCQDCTADTSKCTKCMPGYMVNATTNQCDNCTVDLCTDCRNGIDTCYRCELGYSPNKLTNKEGMTYDKCITCAENCKGCQLGGYSDCDLCDDNYTLMKNKDSTLCIHSSQATACQSRMQVNDKIYCYQCADGYALTVDSMNCAYNKFKKCRVYFNDQQNCFDCEEGYGLVIDTSDSPVFPMGTKCVPRCDLRMHKIEGTSCSQQLLKLLLYINNYDVGVVAKSAGSIRIHVYIGFTLQNIISINQMQGSFSFIGNPVMMWRDDRVNWEPSMWRDNDYVVVSSDSLWKPDLVYINNASENTIFSNNTNIKVYAGTKSTYWYNIIWSPKGFYELSHSYSLFYFPADIQKLQIRMESKSFNSSLMVLHLRSEQLPDIPDLVTRSYVKNNISFKYLKWEVELTEIEYASKYYSVSFYVFMQRIVESHETMIFYPVLMMVALGIANLYIEDMVAKSCNGFIILLTVSVYMTVINQEIPSIKYNILLEYIYFVIFVSLFIYMSMVYMRWIMLEYRDKKKEEELKFIEQFHNYEAPQQSSDGLYERILEIANIAIISVGTIIIWIFFYYIQYGDSVDKTT